ncbi:hypothetical protein GCM10012275_62720 [Longimycelium tulufanense]|uniref:Isoprenylcysteine carboxyl methyltransferase n=1 Tax=Longimycelium tulufanense TaxID=907463 RepID=A0A8J3CEX5_9PSEU|nr:isoprenylcysteine carboxylmethyltransferase family protein [Longimycelium tulufanense]GGM83572.1 hypothetical protein GCM10012275_62720 [Longimycelium tulufanense]
MSIAVAALTLWILWLLLAFGVRIAVSLRRTGDAGLRMGTAPPGSAQWWGKTLFALVALAACAAFIADLAGLPRIGLLHHPALQAVGVVLALIGIPGTLIAQLAMGDSWRIGVDETERTPLVTTGVFRYVRNPIFTAMLLTAAGLALMVPNVFSLAGTAILLGAIELLVRVVEEPYLQRAHGTDFHRYAAQVGRFIPGIGRLTPTSRTTHPH